MIHEGVNTSSIRPLTSPISFGLKKAKISIKSGDPVVIFVNRNLESYRGIHISMRMLPILQRLHPIVQAVIVGSDGISYD